MSEEDKIVLRDALRKWRDGGVVNPTIPMYADADGDGVPDFYGLDENDELVVVPGTLQESVSESTGEVYDG